MLNRVSGRELSGRPFGLKSRSYRLFNALPSSMKDVIVLGWFNDQLVGWKIETEIELLFFEDTNAAELPDETQELKLLRSCRLCELVSDESFSLRLACTGKVLVALVKQETLTDDMTSIFAVGEDYVKSISHAAGKACGWCIGDLALSLSLEGCFVLTSGYSVLLWDYSSTRRCVWKEVSELLYEFDMEAQVEKIQATCVKQSALLDYELKLVSVELRGVKVILELKFLTGSAVLFGCVGFDDGECRWAKFSPGMWNFRPSLCVKLYPDFTRNAEYDTFTMRSLKHSYLPFEYTVD